MRRVIVVLVIAGLAAGALVGVATADQSDGTDRGNGTAAELNVTWERSYDAGGGRDVFHDAARAGEGYLLVGTAERGEYGSDRWDGLLVRVTANGAVVWDGPLGGSGANVLTEAVALEDGFLVGGMANGSSRFGGGSNRWLARLGPEGEVRWSRVYESAGGFDRIEGLTVTPDGQVVAVGGSTGMRVDPGSGSIVWERPYATVVTDATTLADGYALTGTSVAESDVLDGWLGRIHGDGTPRWNRHYVRDGFNRPEALAATTDGGFVLGGRSDADGTSELPAWVVGTDGEGNVTFERYLRDPTTDGWIYGMTAARENHVAVAGKSIPGTGWLVLLNGEGETVTSHEFGSAAKGVLGLGDGEFLVVGEGSRNRAVAQLVRYPPLEAPERDGPETETESRPRTTSELGSGFAVVAALFALTVVPVVIRTRRR